jgi:cytochrome c oxidase subunit 2
MKRARMRAAYAACLAGIAGTATASIATLDAQGPQARRIADLSLLLYGSAAAIFLVVLILAALALFGPPQLRARLARRSMVIGGGIVFPIIALSALMIHVFGDTLGREEPSPALSIDVIAEQYWWRIRYGDARSVAFETANELHIPIGREVELRLHSADVIHSFWVPGLHGKLDMIPGRVNALRIQADKTGVSRGQCAEYCGTQHARMALTVHAQTAEDFEHWFAQQRRPQPLPADAQLQRGRDLFLAQACAACHTVRGTAANGRLGPDLTHVAARATLGAGTVVNTPGALAGWIADSQALKPGNRMPAFAHLSGDELHALTAYVASLR